MAMSKDEKYLLASLIWYPKIRFYAKHIDKRFLTTEGRNILDIIMKNETSPAEDIVLLLARENVCENFDFLDAGATSMTAQQIIIDYINQQKTRMVANKMKDVGNKLTKSDISVDEALDEISDYRQMMILESPIQSAKDVAHQEQEMLEKVWSGELEALEWSYKSLEQMCNGLWGEELCVIAGRPGMGKTTFMLNLLERWAKEGRKVGFISLEMKARSLVLKACQKQFPVVNLHRSVSTLQRSDRERLNHEIEKFAKLPIVFSDSGKTDLPTILSTIQNMRYTHKAEVVAIDYLQLIRSHKKHQNRDQEVGDISRALKQMAMNLNMPIIVGAQLNRETERQDKGKPLLRNLRESGNIEQDADLIMFLYRPYYYTKNEMEKDDLEVLVRKQRNGAVGDIELKYYMNLQQIVDPL